MTVEKEIATLGPLARLTSHLAAVRERRLGFAIKAGAWSGAGFAAMQGLRMVSTVLIANRLEREEVGLVGLVTVLLMGLGMLSDLGITPNVVQSKHGDEDDYLNTAFTIQIIRGLGLTAIALALAYPFAQLYEESRLTLLVVGAAVSVLLRAFASPSIWTCTRHVEVHKLTLVTVSSEVVGFVAALWWATVSPSAWALVGGTVAASAAYVLGSYVIGAKRPSLRMSRLAAAEIISFGKWMFLSTATFFAASQAERLVMGKYMSLAELGSFTLAVTMAFAPSRGVQQLIEQVFFPLIARLRREDPPRAVDRYIHAKWVSCVLACGAAITCVGFGPPVVKLLLKPDYASAGWMLQLLGFRAAGDILVCATTSMLFAGGQSRFAAAGNIVRVMILVPGIWLSLSHGRIDAAIWVLALAPLGSYFVPLMTLYRTVRPAFKTEVVTLAIFLAVAIATALTRFWIVGG